MHITRAGEYGVLGMTALARRPRGTVVMIDEISREEDIPKSFMGKIFQSLSRAGLAQSVRGTGGGVTLAKAPEEITVLAVIEGVEGPIALQRCLEDKPDCVHLGHCALCGLFAEAQDRLRETLARTTLAELAQRQPPRGRKPEVEPEVFMTTCPT